MVGNDLSGKNWTKRNFLRSCKREGYTNAAHLFAVRGHQIEATRGDVQVDGHSGKLQVALPQDAGQSFGRWLKGPEVHTSSKRFFTNAVQH